MVSYRYACEVRALCCGCNATGISSLLTVSRKSRYALENEVVGCCLINAGDSTQRLCNENKIKLSKISVVILTSFAPQNISGLSGILLSLSDLGVGSITICGPTGLDALLDVMTPFTNRKYPQLLTQIINKDDITKILLLDYFTIYLEPIHVEQSLAVSSNGINMNSIAIYATIIPTVISDNNKRSFISHGISCLPYETTFVVSPSITNSIRAIYTSFKDLIAIILLCPMSTQASIKGGHERMLATINEFNCSNYYSFIFFTSQLDNKFCEIVQTQRSLAFLRSLSHSSGCISSAPFARLLSKVDLKESHSRTNITKDFSLSRNGDVVVATPLLFVELPVIVVENMSLVDDVDRDFGKNKKIKKNEIFGSAPIMHWSLLAEEVRLQYSLNNTQNLAGIVSETIGSLISKEIKDESTDCRINNDIKKSTNEVISNRAAATLLKASLKRNERQTAVPLPALCIPCSALNEATAHMEDIEITFLGTGSATPSKFRSNSCIMLQSPVHSGDSGGRSGLLLDVGEGSAAQLFYCSEGNEERFYRMLDSVGVIWTSHHHADHICGFLMLLHHMAIARKSAGGNGRKKTLVFGPEAVVRYFEFVACICGLDDFVDFTQNKDTLENGVAGMAQLQRLNNASNGFVKGLVSVPVYHCRDSYGVVVYLQGGQKIVYSGDCRPSSSLIDAGSNCDLLIHEATFDDQMRDDAQSKRHSTTSEAVGVALQMKAKHLILTHFSQRYVSILHSTTSASHSMAFVAAFDFLRVQFPSDMTSLPNISMAIEEKRRKMKEFIC